MDYDTDFEPDYTVVDPESEQCKYAQCDGDCADCEWHEEEV